MGVKCVSCERVYTTKSQARRHWRDVHGPKEYCPWCPYTVARSRVASLVTHMKGCREQPGDRRVVKSTVHVVHRDKGNANDRHHSTQRHSSPLPLKRDGEKKKSPGKKCFSRLVVERESSSTWRDDEEVSVDAGAWSLDEETSTPSPYHPGPPTSDTHVEYLPTPKTTIVVTEPTNPAIAVTAEMTCVRKETARPLRSSPSPVPEKAGGFSSPPDSPGTGPAPMDLKELIHVWADSLTEPMVHVTGDQAMSGMDHCELLNTPPTTPAQPESPEKTSEGILMTETPTCTQPEKPPSALAETPACSPAEKPPSAPKEMSSTLTEMSTLSETPACLRPVVAPDVEQATLETSQACPSGLGQSQRCFIAGLKGSRCQ